MIWEVVLHAVVNLREVVRGPKPSQSLRCTLRVTPSPDPCHATFHQERNERLPRGFGSSSRAGAAAPAGQCTFGALAR
jgi:hypothetical protein